MPTITTKQLREYERLCYERDHGQMLTPDGLRFICASYNYDPEAIGKHMLEMLGRMQNQAVLPKLRID